MAAGEGRRLRPITDRWPKPVLPIDGRPVLATLLRELARAELGPVWLVVGHLADQVEALAGDGSAFGVEIRAVQQPEPLGSADAVARAVEAGARPPVLVMAADTVFRAGDLTRFAAAYAESGTSGAIAVRREPPPGPGRTAVAISDGFVEHVRTNDPAAALSGAPLWALGEPIVARLRCDREPHELGNSFQAAIDAGEQVAAIEIGRTRDLTDPLDLVEENFPYLA